MYIALVTAITYASRKNPNWYVSSKCTISDVFMEITKHTSMVFA